MAKKSNHQTDRQSIAKFEQIINVGPATAGDFDRLGITKPQQLIGQDPVKLYRKICSVDNLFHDPCVLDVFLATIDFMNGNKPQAWWKYTNQRKEQFADEVEKIRSKYE
ncbi:MAG: helix-hairpin-helix domain-containing protein [Mariniblastus sp.]